MLKKKDLIKRVWLLDELRGLFILLMVLYHACYDLVYLFDVPIVPMQWEPVQWTQLLIAGLFVFISGIACHYSHNNWKRGVLCFACGMLMTLGSMLFVPSQTVRFGVLHFLGVAMLLFVVVWPLLRSIPPAVGLVLCACLFFLTYNTQSGYWGMRGWEISLPASWYTTSFLFPLGLPQPGFQSSDYFPFLPWLFWFFGGAFAGVYVHEKKCPDWVYLPHSRFFAFIGRNSLIVYLLHQPVVFGVLSMVFWVVSQ